MCSLLRAGVGPSYKAVVRTTMTDAWVQRAQSWFGFFLCVCVSGHSSCAEDITGSVSIVITAVGEKRVYLRCPEVCGLGLRITGT